jgi:uncharacterized protein (DUF4415 family)
MGYWSSYGLKADDSDDVHAPLDGKGDEGLASRKRDIRLRIDADVLGWFKQAGRGYQTRINEVLRAFTESRRTAG